MYNKIILSLLFIFSTQVFGGDCSVKERTSNYKTIERQLTQMLSLLPVLKPSDKDFFKEVAENLYKEPAKYKKFLSDDDYTVFSNMQKLEDHLHWVRIALKSLATGNINQETHAFSRLMIGGIKDVYWISHFSDSQYLARKKIVTSEYADLGKRISISYGSVALCMAKHYQKQAQ